MSKFTVTLANERLEVVTKPGLPDWRLIAPSAQLFADLGSVKPADKILLLGSSEGAFATYLARKLIDGQLTITDSTSTALDATQRTLSENNFGGVNILANIELPQELYQAFDSVYMQVPKGRQLARRWLVQAYHALGDSGSLYVSGSNRAGVQSVIKDAQELFGAGRILGYKKGNRIGQFIKKTGNEIIPGWVHEPGIAPHTWVEFPIALSGQSFNIRSLPGIFSFDHLDEATKMLLDIINIPAGAKVLDMGCGYGVIGLFAAVHGASLVHLMDNNLLAVEASRENLARNRITCAKVFARDLLDGTAMGQYDLVLSNPPFHTGHAVDYQVAHAMIEQSYRSLVPGGKLIIVANRFIRYNHLIRDIFRNALILAETGKFHVISGLKSK